MKIIGITGTNGSGKGEVVEYLKSKGFAHSSWRAFITEEILKRGLPVNRDTMSQVGNSLRKEHGASYIAETFLRQAKDSGEDTVMESIRAMGELQKLREEPSFYLVAVDASPEIRFERMKGRGSESDNESLEKLKEQERVELNSDDPAKHSVRGVMREADFHIENNSTLEELHSKVDEILKKIEG